jgi:hypothetical protein
MSYLNGVWAPGAVQAWEDEECYDVIRRQLGYRFEVIRVEYTPTVAAGTEKFLVSVQIKNTGWARLHKPREARLVLRGESPPSHVYTGPESAVEGWAPGQTITLAFSDAVVPGTYSVRLWIPDPDDPGNLNQDPDVKGNFHYSVKLASRRDGNKIFDPSTGDNDLGVTIIVQ